MDKKVFFDSVRKSLFNGRLKDTQVQNMEIILEEATSRNVPLRHLAYILATTYHEVGSDMVPIRENLNYTSVGAIRRTWPTRFRSDGSAAPYVKNPRGLANKVYGGRMGNNTADDGWIYRGGGYPQTTGKENYEESGKIVGVDLVKNPERILEPRIAAVTMIVSMTKGLYTTLKLSDFLSGEKPDYRKARGIINGDVKKNGQKIADHAVDFEKALALAGYGIAAPAFKPEPAPVVVEEPKPAPAPAPEPEKAPETEPLPPRQPDDVGGPKKAPDASPSWFAKLVDVILSVFARR